MSLTHAVVWTDHQTARILKFDAEHLEAQQIRASSHHTRQHKSGVRTEHEFFGEVCDSLKSSGEVLVTGSRVAVADFRHYAEKHRPHVVPLIKGYEVVDQPTDPQLVALARSYFLKLDRMEGVNKPF